MEKHFGKLPAAVIALEAGTQSGWIARLLRHLGHQVIVANPRDLAAVTSSKKKSDRNDAEKLARLARADLKLLNPTYVRSLESARDAIPLRARDGFVRARTQLVNVARSLAKIEGRRLPATITKTFGERALSESPAAVAGSMELLLRMIDFLSMAIGISEFAIGIRHQATQSPFRWAHHSLPAVLSRGCSGSCSDFGFLPRFRGCRVRTSFSSSSATKSGVPNGRPVRVAWRRRSRSPECRKPRPRTSFHYCAE